MLTYEWLSQRPRIFQRLTGLTTDEFAQLLDKFQSAWQGFVATEFLAKQRQRRFGAGRLPRLRLIHDKLLFMLVYVRIYPTMVIQGLFFGFEDSRACTWVGRLLPLLDAATGLAHIRPVRGQGRSLDKILLEFPELRELGIVLDGSERPRRRPKNSQRQTELYSGKKKRHTTKNVAIVHPHHRRVLYLSRTRAGTVHDKRLLDEERLTCHDPTLAAAVDSGFLGLTLGQLRVILPQKKTKLHPLSESDQEQNHALASARVVVEHAFAGVKMNQSVAAVYRNLTESYNDLFMSIACSLHNLRVVSRHRA